MSDESLTYITIGKIGATYGIRGWLKIHSFTEFGSSIFEYKPWYIRPNPQSAWQEITIAEGKAHGKGCIAKFNNIETPEAARVYTGFEIAILRSQLPTLAKDEYYWSDLVGLTVVNKDGQELGKVAYLIETGSNDVLVIKADKEYAIPFITGQVILDVDLKAGLIRVDWELI